MGIEHEFWWMNFEIVSNSRGHFLIMIMFATIYGQKTPKPNHFVIHQVKWSKLKGVWWSCCVFRPPPWKGMGGTNTSWSFKILNLEMLNSYGGLTTIKGVIVSYKGSSTNAFMFAFESTTLFTFSFPLPFPFERTFLFPPSPYVPTKLVTFSMNPSFKLSLNAIFEKGMLSLGQSRYQPIFKRCEDDLSLNKYLWNIVLFALGSHQISKRLGI